MMLSVVRSAMVMFGLTLWGCAPSTPLDSVRKQVAKTSPADYMGAEVTEGSFIWSTDSRATVEACYRGFAHAAQDSRAASMHRDAFKNIQTILRLVRRDGSAATVTIDSETIDLDLGPEMGDCYRMLRKEPMGHTYAPRRPSRRPSTMPIR